MAKPLKTPAGIDLSAVHPLNALEKEVTAAASLNRSDGMLSREEQPLNMLLSAVILVNPSRIQAGISFSDEQPWKIMFIPAPLLP